MIACSPSDLQDLLKAGVETARTAIVLSSQKLQANPDGTDNLADDTEAIVVASAIYKLNPKLHIMTEVVHGPHASYLRPCGTSLGNAEDAASRFISSLRAQTLLKMKEERRRAKHEERVKAKAAQAAATAAAASAASAPASTSAATAAHGASMVGFRSPAAAAAGARNPASPVTAAPAHVHASPLGALAAAGTPSSPSSTAAAGSLVALGSLAGRAPTPSQLAFASPAAGVPTMSPSASDAPPSPALSASAVMLSPTLPSPGAGARAAIDLTGASSAAAGGAVDSTYAYAPGSADTTQGAPLSIDASGAHQAAIRDAIDLAIDDDASGTEAGVEVDGDGRDEFDVNGYPALSPAGEQSIIEERLVRQRIRLALGTGDSIGRTLGGAKPQVRPGLAGVFSQPPPQSSSAAAGAGSSAGQSSTRNLMHQAAAGASGSSASDSSTAATSSAAGDAAQPASTFGTGRRSTAGSASPSPALAGQLGRAAASSSGGGANEFDLAAAGNATAGAPGDSWAINVDFATVHAAAAPSHHLAGGVDAPTSVSSDPWSSQGALAPPTNSLQRIGSVRRGVASPRLGGGSAGGGTGVAFEHAPSLNLDGSTMVANPASSAGGNGGVDLTSPAGVTPAAGAGVNAFIGSLNASGVVSDSKPDPLRQASDIAVTAAAAATPSPPPSSSASAPSGSSGFGLGSLGAGVLARAAAPNDIFGAPAFAAGRAFSSTTLDALLCEAHFAPHVIFLIKNVSILSRRVSELMLVL